MDNDGRNQSMTETRTALISGVNGQDGAYLARLLVEKDTEFSEPHAMPPVEFQQPEAFGDLRSRLLSLDGS